MPGSVTLFISPHLDDAVFSCGGTIARLVSTGREVVIVTIFTADDNGERPLSWLARRLSRSWDLGEKPFSVRCEEDRQAGAVLSAQVLHLGLLDAVYRRDASGEPLYQHSITTTPLHAHDLENMVATLQARLQELKGTYTRKRVLMASPLGLGGHVDHRLVRHAVEAICAPEDRFYYEDFPYSILAQGLESGGNPQVAGLLPHMVKISSDEARLRVGAMACYRSQLAGCFPSRLEILVEILRARLPVVGQALQYRPDLQASLKRMEARMNEHLSRTGGERYWVASKDIFMELETHAE